MDNLKISLSDFLRKHVPDMRVKRVEFQDAHLCYEDAYGYVTTVAYITDGTIYFQCPLPPLLACKIALYYHDIIESKNRGDKQ